VGRKVVRPGVILVTTGYPIRRNNVMPRPQRCALAGCRLFHQEISDFPALHEGGRRRVSRVSRSASRLIATDARADRPERAHVLIVAHNYAGCAGVNYLGIASGQPDPRESERGILILADIRDPAGYRNRAVPFYGRRNCASTVRGQTERRLHRRRG